MVIPNEIKGTGQEKNTPISKTWENSAYSNLIILSQGMNDKTRGRLNPYYKRAKM